MYVVNYFKDVLAQKTLWKEVITDEEDGLGVRKLRLHKVSNYCLGVSHENGALWRNLIKKFGVQKI